MDGSKKLPFCAKHFRHSCRNCLLRVRVDILRQLNAFGKKWFHIQLRKFSQMVLTGTSKLPTPCPEVFFGIVFASKKRFNTYFRILSEKIGQSTNNSAQLSKLHCISRNEFLTKTDCFEKLRFCNNFSSLSGENVDLGQRFVARWSKLQYIFPEEKYEKKTIAKFLITHSFIQTFSNKIELLAEISGMILRIALCDSRGTSSQIFLFSGNRYFYIRFCTGSKKLRALLKN